MQEQTTTILIKILQFAIWVIFTFFGFIFSIFNCISYGYYVIIFICLYNILTKGGFSNSITFSVLLIIFSVFMITKNKIDQNLKFEKTTTNIKKTQTDNKSLTCQKVTNYPQLNLDK